MGASVPDQALVASDQAASRLAPTGFDPSRKSVCQRLPTDFKFVFSVNETGSLLQVSGPIKTQDELNAITEALEIMREWLAVSDEVPPAASNGEAGPEDIR